MTWKLAIFWFGSVVALMAAAPADLLRFTNGDQLHGEFEGIHKGPQIVWKRDDLAAPVEFKISQVRQIVLHGGHPIKPQTSLSHVALVNGDRIPGKITALNEKSISLDTDFAGPVTISREQVAMLAPNPLGGRIHYHGPFSADDWEMVNASFPDGLPPVKPGDAEKDDDAPGRWSFNGAAWYWQNKLTGTALIHKNVMPERAILRFDLAWKNRLSIAVGFQADFARPKQGKDDAEPKNAPAKVQRFMPGDSAVLPVLFGNAYVMHIFSSHLMLYRTSVDGHGVSSIGRVQVNSNNARLTDTGKATIEIRSNQKSGLISLFIDGEFVAQWSDGGGAMDPTKESPATGTGFGFVVQSDNSPVRVSDVMVAEWNGMPDSARSLEVDDHDIVLLANGTDRFAGNVKSFADGKIMLENNYGEFKFPLDDVAEIRFARGKLAKESETPADSMTIRFDPLGQVTGIPATCDGKSLQLLHPFAGELNVALDSAVMLDFQPSNTIIDDWDADF